MSIKLGVLSNAAREEGAAWETCVLAPFFDTVVFSYQVGRMKPDPQVYWLACERLGTPAADTLFVGDGGSDELVGAAQAGLTGLLPEILARPDGWRLIVDSSGLVRRAADGALLRDFIGQSGVAGGDEFLTRVHCGGDVRE